MAFTPALSLDDRTGAFAPLATDVCRASSVASRTIHPAGCGVDEVKHQCSHGQTQRSSAQTRGKERRSIGPMILACNQRRTLTELSPMRNIG